MLPFRPGAFFGLLAPDALSLACCCCSASPGVDADAFQPGLLALRPCAVVVAAAAAGKEGDEDEAEA